MTPDEAKRAAAAAALEAVEAGMRLGLGTGSTARHFVDLLGQRVAGGLDVVCVPTSEATRAQAEALGIRLSSLDELAELDLTVDGADEVAPDLTLIKGGGGAHLREKIVATASRRMIVIADETKRVDTLGRFPLPVEIVRFGLEAVRRGVGRAVAAAGCAGELVLRRGADGHVFVTDCGNLILDAHLGRIGDPSGLARALSDVPGVVEHGLFIEVADEALIAGAAGVTRLRAPARRSGGRSFAGGNAA